MKITVLRRWLFANESIGKLYINGVFSGIYTLEDRVRPQGEKIAGKTAIPYGRYPLEITYSDKFAQLMPLILNVPMFSGIRIHTGNDADDTEGCLLVGLERGDGSISRSREAYELLFSRLAEAKQRGERITIEFISVDMRIFRVVLAVVALVAIAFVVYTIATDTTKKK